ETERHRAERVAVEVLYLQNRGAAVAQDRGTERTRDVSRKINHQGPGQRAAVVGLRCERFNPRTGFGTPLPRLMKQAINRTRIEVGGAGSMQNFAGRAVELDRYAHLHSRAQDWIMQFAAQSEGAHLSVVHTLLAGLYPR